MLRNYSTLSASTALVLLALATAPASAQTSPTAQPVTATDQADEPADPDLIVVTGVRGANRTVLDSPVPIDVLAGADVAQAASVGETAQALQNLTPSLNFPRQSNSGAGDTVRAAQLRGLSPDQTLVLVNGRRYHTTSTPNLDTKIGRGTTPVDLNTIPVNAIGRVEVLRDGAGAQYGSDAIAGVINIGLERLRQGGSVGISYGLNVTRPGAIDENLRDGRTTVIDAKLGTGLGENGFLTVGGDFIWQQGTNRAGFDDGGNFLTNGSYSDPRNFPFFGQRLFKVGDPRVRSGHLWYNAEALTGDVTLYSFAILHRRKAEGANFFRWPVIVDGNGNNYLPPQLPDGLNGFRPVSVVNNRDVSFTAGARTNLGEWKADGSVTYGRNWISYRLRDSINYSLGANSPNRFLLSKVRSDQLVGNLDFSRPLDLGLFRPAILAIGAEVRRESWKSSAGDPASYAVGPLADPSSLGLQPGAQAGPGLTPEDARNLDRTVVAAYAELSADLTENIFADIAGRIERYSDAGTSVAGKAALRWEFATGYALRGSISNSFRAPTVGQLGASSTSLTFGSGGQLRRVSTLPVDSAAGQALGIRDLTPEKSFNLSVGVTANPIRGLRLSLDAFRILVDDRVTLSERFDLTDLTPAQRTTLGLGSFDAINFFTNAVDLKTRGIEAVADYRTRAFGGDLGVNAAWSYAKNDIRRVKSPPSELAQFGIPGGLIGLEERNTLTSAVPRSKLIFGVDWSNTKLDGLVRLTRFGSVTRVFDFGGGFTPIQRNPSQWSVDSEVSVKVGKLRLSVGGNNLFDNYPDQSIPDINGAGNLAYDILSPIGVNGRYLYARARLGF